MNGLFKYNAKSDVCATRQVEAIGFEERMSHLLAIEEKEKRAMEWCQRGVIGGA